MDQASLPERYPYFVASLMLAATIPVYLALAGPQRRAAAWSGLLFAPLGLVAPLFGRDYWAVDRLGGLPVGVEDLIYNAQLGVASWFFASLPFRRRLRIEWQSWPMLGRAATLAAALLVGFATGRLAETSPFTWALWIAFGLVVLLLALRPALWPLALSAALLHGVALTVSLAIALALWPQFAGTWVPTHALAGRVLGVPLGEILWGSIAPAGHALAFGFIARARLAPRTEAA